MGVLNNETSLKAVGLLSGGLDSALAAKIIKDLNVDVHGIHFVLPWHIKPNPSVISIAQQLSIPLEVFYFGEEFLDLIKAPKYGYGSALNPCTDCHAYQLKKAKDFMKKIGADFVFTGEVLGQRPMSQQRHHLEKIEKECGLIGLLLRPLSAKLLDPIIIEQQGRIDREKLYSFSGRSRSELLRLGQSFGIKNFIQAGGGCLLAEKIFAKRVCDVFQYGHRDLNDIVLLSLGRHFRLSPSHKVIVGRDEAENTRITEYANQEDTFFQLKDLLGPLVLLQGKDPGKEVIAMTASLVSRFSRFREKEVDVCFWPKNDERYIQVVKTFSIDERSIAKLWIS